MQAKHRLHYLLSLLLITPIGFYSKFYSGPYATWVNHSLGGVFYVIFWCLVWGFFTPFKFTNRIVLTVVSLTCFLEFLQLWNPSFLAFLRSSFIGRTILGNSFCWQDFPYYFIGGILGYVWLKGIQKKQHNDESSK